MIKLQELTQIQPNLPNTYGLKVGSTPPPAYFSNSTKEFIYESDVENAKKSLKLFKDSKLVEGDKVYFSKSSTVPRYKFSQYTSTEEGKGIVRTIKADNATAFIINPDYMMNIITSNTSYQEMIVIDKVHLSGFSSHVWTDQVIMANHKNNIDNFEKVTGVKLDTIPHKKLAIRTYYDKATCKKNIEEYNSIYNAMNNKKIVHDSSLLEEINKGTILTLETMDEIIRMLSSSDSADVTFAMDIMANCDYKACELKLVMLLNGYHVQMEKNSAWKLVNFQSMLEYFKGYAWSGNTVQFAESILKKSDSSSIDASERVEVVRKMMLAYIEKTIPSNVFKVKEIYINA